MDEVLFQATMHALATRIKDTDLPLLTSSLYAQYILPCRCVWCHAPHCSPAGSTLDLKLTSYKKLGKFLEVLQEKGIVVVKEISKVALVTID